VQRILENWDRDLKRVDQLLVEGEPKKAYRIVSSLLEEMANRFIGGPLVGEFLATGTVLRALAAYQMGNEDEALWHWHVANQLFPKVANLTMSAYGDAGPFLKVHPPRMRNEPAPGVYAEFEKAITKRAEKLRAPKPDFPAARLGSEPVAIVVQAIVGIDGKLREPVIYQSKGELTLVCATLDATRRWEFVPAESEGEKVPVYYTLTVNFRS
jgi:hypothetical protein